MKEILTAVGIFIGIAWSQGAFKGWEPSEGLVRALILGAFLGLIAGAAILLRALWRKLLSPGDKER